mgnify:CR=1 FL=1
MKKILTILCTVASVGGAALFCVCFVARRLKPKNGRSARIKGMPQTVSDQPERRDGQP